MQNSESQIRNLLSQAWMALAQEIENQMQKEVTPSFYIQERTKTMLSFIHQHYSEKITINDMAEHVGVLVRECIRSFKNTFHQTPMDYLISYRIEQAKRLFKETEEPITNIVFQTGFQTSAYLANN